MALRYRARPGRLLAVFMATAAFVAAFGGSAAFAVETAEDLASFEETFDQLQNTPVYKSACTETCHGNIAKTTNYSSAIIFQHGYHQLVACASCHPRFPHRADQTIERPSMQGCFDCHGLRHGPMGILASDACEDCHVTPKERLRPAFHTWDWAAKPHVDPANKEFNTKCAMCHDKASCDDCHQSEGVEWRPASWDYDSGDGCQACHGNAGLTKQSSAGQESFQVLGVDDSVHQGLSCGQCHPDYRYDDAPPASNVWTVNAGVACAECHADADALRAENPDLTDEQVEYLGKSVPEYQDSVHAEKLREGDYESATCASCHGGHFIYSLQTATGEARMQQSAYRVCARCHNEEYGTYNDYYHGKAYKAGTPDAPACWDCHESHNVKPSDDPESSMSTTNKGETCGQEGCHSGSDEEFAAASGELIHEAQTETEANPIVQFISGVFGE